MQRNSSAWTLWRTGVHDSGKETTTTKHLVQALPRSGKDMRDDRSLVQALPCSGTEMTTKKLLFVLCLAQAQI